MIVALMAAMPLGCSDDPQDMHQQIVQSAKPTGVPEAKPATVRDLRGDWEASIENYGPRASDGRYPNVFRITQTGSEFTAIRFRDNPPPSVARAGSVTVRGEVDETGFKRVEIVRGTGDALLSKGYISADGKQITLDDGFMTRMTLTRK
jgi:hypothetical protein